MVMTRCRAAAAALLLLVALSGCRLVDQRTFERAPVGPSPTAQAQAILPPLPLVTINFANGGGDWRAQVDAAVLQAQARKADVAFDVVVPIPTSASRKAQDDAAQTGQSWAQTVADALQQDGIPAARITLSLRGDAGAPPPEVLLYVR